LLDEFDGRTNCLCQFGHAHDDSQPSTAKGSDGKLIVDITELGRSGEDTHVVKLGEKLALHFCTKGILGRKE